MVLDVVLGAGRRIAARVVHAGRAVRCNLEGLPRLCLAILVRRHVERARRRRRVRLVDELDMRLGLVWLDGVGCGHVPRCGWLASVFVCVLEVSA